MIIRKETGPLTSRVWNQAFDVLDLVGRQYAGPAV